MGIFGFLTLIPLVAAALCLVVPGRRVREVVVYVAAAIIVIASITLATDNLSGEAVYYDGHPHWVDWVCFAIDLCLCAYVMWRAVKADRKDVFALACVQLILVCVLEFFVAGKVEVARAVYIDSLSAIMVLIVGIIGSGIIVYACGYMRDFQHHQDELAEAGEEAAPDRQNLFFAAMFAFLAAMFGLVLSNALTWMLTMWEVTTVCSFFLIGYTKTREATANAFRQIWMNLLGGIAFTLALIFMGTYMGVLELDQFVRAGLAVPGLAMLPLALLAFAALTKAAQMPFHTWLLGAMVAPTPTSALLHSSTMVKAGVFLLLRLSPLMGTFMANPLHFPSVNPVGIAVMLVGCTTFLVCSVIAIGQSNAKRVLAYSTIANLGLIVTCAGIGTSAAVWAGIFLLVFHAVAKSLLFLCVGTAEHHIGSRDIECMDALVSRMPKLAALMALGICGMFVAPFGMLISKWAALGAFIDSGVMLLVVMLGFGSAATFLFWAKWLGKILCSVRGQDNLEEGVHASEWVALGIMGAGVVLLAVTLPVVSEKIVAPYVSSLVGGGALVSPDASDLAVMAVTALVVSIAPALVAMRVKTRREEQALNPNLGGVGLSQTTFRGSLGDELSYAQRNWYMEEFFDEKKLGLVGSVVCILVALAGISCAVGLSHMFITVMGSVI